MPESTSPSPTNPFKKMKLAANRALIVAIIAILLAALLGLLAGKYLDTPTPPKNRNPPSHRIHPKKHP